MRFSWYYYAIAMALLLILTRWYKNLSFSILVSYLFLVLVATLLSRNPTNNVRYKLIPFQILRVHSDGKTMDLSQQMIANIVMFVPIGSLFTLLSKRCPILCGAILSFSYEILQLISRRGVFEVDDIIYNTCGAAIGVLLVSILKKFKNRI